MASCEYEVTQQEGKVSLLAFDDNDDLEVHTMSPEDARALGRMLISMANQAEGCR